MFEHEPAGYRCPFCLLGRGDSTAINDQQDLVSQTADAMAFVAPRWWPNNRGSVLVVPVDQHENLNELPTRCGKGAHDLTQAVAVAMRSTYGCTGTSTRQHNEPAGDQDVWHYHVHVFPRYPEDRLYSSRPHPEFVALADRRPFAAMLRRALDRT